MDDEHRPERNACVAIDPVGFHLRPPPAPHLLGAPITPDECLFETIHMGAAVVDIGQWRLVVDGLVDSPLQLAFDDLQRFPAVTLEAFHECYGSPLTPPVKALWRVGNVRWTGIRLCDVLAAAGVRPAGRFVWSEGLDHGAFAGVQADRYQKDLPLEKALAPEVLLAFAMNGAPLRKERGGPVRLVVPGWYGTNMTKWLCRLSVQDRRAPSPYTTRWYNEPDPADPTGKTTRPVWPVEANSLIVWPAPDDVLPSGGCMVHGWAWGDQAVSEVQVSGDGGKRWETAAVESRRDFGWQRFSVTLRLSAGRQILVARARCGSGPFQPITGRRNHAHHVSIMVVDPAPPL
jgi:DMSO/TMAO reductase YedYZ molybdopterin-dependent catalytic subunit